jgi:hypothetical protein
MVRRHARGLVHYATPRALDLPRESGGIAAEEYSTPLGCAPNDNATRFIEGHIATMWIPVPSRCFQVSLVLSS